MNVMKRVPKKRFIKMRLLDSLSDRLVMFATILENDLKFFHTPTSDRVKAILLSI